jgi:hypothetical protein
MGGKMPETTLPTLLSISRAKPVLRELCCPTCGGNLVLDEGLLWCQLGTHVFERLEELGVRNDVNSPVGARQPLGAWDEGFLE